MFCDQINLKTIGVKRLHLSSLDERVLLICCKAHLRPLLA
jgi:hypothetical protein